ncbi:MAG: CoA transferase subunit A [Thermoplasmata archaeon]|nr:MAG: CoA transferase subunit A [Thermoplasmata archaeon]
MNETRNSKLITCQEAVEKYVKDGCFLAVGGMHMHNNPMALVHETIRKKRKIKQLIASPSANMNAELFFAANLVEEIYLSYVGFEHLGLAPMFRKSAQEGKIKVHECDEGFIIYSLRAGAGGLPFIPYPKGMEYSDIPKVNPQDFKETTDPFTGEKVICAPPLNPDVALIHCQKSDEFGNAIFEGSKFTDEIMAHASKYVIVQVEEVVPHSYIEKHPGEVDLPAFIVDAVVHVPFGCHPTASHMYYTFDEMHLKEYLKANKDKKVEEYLAKYIYDISSHEQYLEAVGGQAALEKLKGGGKPW